MAISGDTKKYLRAGLANNFCADEVIESLDQVHGQPASVTIAAAAGGSNVCEVTFTVKDVNGTAMTVPTLLTVFLSDAATGVGLTGTSASGTVQAKASSGTDFSTLVSKKALRVQTKADGTYILEITDTAKTTFYPCAYIDGRKVTVGTQLVTGNYG